MGGPTRPKYIRKKRKRKEKLRKLREKYKLAKTQDEKDKILEKVWKIAPWISREEFLNSIKQEEKEESSVQQ
ncbi:hypothetical protein J7J12_02245 [bacterium]|nr:hypothetical protein [bacterium]